MKNYKSFEVKYIPATNHKPSRVKIHDCRKGETKIIPYDSEYNSIIDMAIEYLKTKHIEIVGTSEVKTGYILLSNDFANSIK